MRIVSWNVNGIRAAERKGFLDWLQQEQPDIVCVQESKIQPDQVTKKLRHPEGYATLWTSGVRKGYSSTATFVKEGLEPQTLDLMGVQQFDDEGRVQILRYPDFNLINAYFPNSRDERARLGFKLEFFNDITRLCADMVAKGENVILCGDYNVAHKPIDLARPKPNENSPGYYIEEREAMTAFLEAGFVDVFRRFDDGPDNYTWWSYRARSRERNVGWRIDYHCVNEAFMPRVKDCKIMPQVMGSDHCPVMLEIE